MEWYPYVVLAHVIGAFGPSGPGTTSIQVRHAVGQAAPQDPKGTTFQPIGPDALARPLDSRCPELLAAIGGGALTALITLMVLKPG